MSLSSTHEETLSPNEALKLKKNSWVMSSMDKKILSTLLALITIIAGFSLATDVFFTPRNFSNLLVQGSINGILAVGMTYVILLAGVDLSVGSVAGLIGIVVGISQAHWGWAESGIPGFITTLVFALAAGILIGVFNGALISILKIHSFVITFGMMVIARGLATIFSGASTISPVGPELNFLGTGTLTGIWVEIVLFVPALAWITFILLDEKKGRAQKSVTPSSRVFFKIFSVVVGTAALYFVSSYKGLPIPVLLCALVAFAGAWILARTRFGRYVFAVGGNAEAARLAGINVKRITFLVFVAMSSLAALASVVLTGRLNSAGPNAGTLFELDAIAAVVIGGTSLKGGKGSVLGSVLGALIITSLKNGMDLLEIQSYYQNIMLGGIVILAVSIDSLVERKMD